ncbi:MAG: PhzF family phenazine biosynthesis isomerase [Alphaproteobacteria bacterium]|nr:PhzF family phenazine biosynthesis isomerase [Alphaproteobacteria bacterium]
MKIPLYQVDAFAGEVFSGNPAAVCPLDDWLPDAVLQAIAAENNLAETAFLVADGEDFRLRWFTPTVEVPLCGHATLASAFVVMERLHPGRASVTFHTMSGPLTVERRGAGYAMTVPRWTVRPVEAPPALDAALGAPPVEAWATDREYVLVYADEAAVRALEPDMAALERFDRECFLATAPGEDVDFVLRFFAPAVGIPEDPVTGSAQCGAAPFWAARLGRETVTSRQVSARGGALRSRMMADAVEVTGQCTLYLEGTIILPG